MKLTAFRIRNFRSIVDTGWQSLSPDNITCLIGQNESGKTSVLEALKLFYTGIISEDVLRSDLSLPEVSCRFSIPQGWLLKVTDNPGTELKELLSGLSHIELTRTWIADLSSMIIVSGEISQYLDSLEDAWRIYLGDVTVKLEQEISVINENERNLAEMVSLESEIRSKLPAGEAKLKGFRWFGKRPAEFENMPDNVAADLKNQMAEIRKKREEISADLRGKQPMKKTGETWQKMLDKFIFLDNHLAELSVRLEERHQKMTLLMRPLDDEDDQEWRSTLNDYRKTRHDRDLKKAELDRHIALSGYIMTGITEEEAEKKVSEIIQSYKSHYNSEILGRKYFEYCPVIELFEDFGSLLPNRIDMEDIITDNELV